MTGEDLHRLIIGKWGQSFDVQIRRVQDRFFVQVMWRFLEQASFPMSEEEYLEQLSTIAEYINAWGCVEQVTDFIEQTTERPRLGKAVSIPVELGSRASEWFVGDR
ncbi:MAG: DUF3067 family protein [Cyanobacteria bacterium P01_E01_bin.6]